MFSVGDLVVYGIHGACRIVDVEKRTVDRKLLQYFVLEPIDSVGTRFLIPTHNEPALSKLQPVMTREELEKMLRSEEVRKDVWISDENQRKQHYRELITGADRVALLRMVRSLHEHKKEISAAGRKFHLCDQNFLRDAEKLLSSEFAVILGVEPDKIGSYVLAAMMDE